MTFASVPEALEAITAWGESFAFEVSEEFGTKWTDVQGKMSPVDKIVYTAELMYAFIQSIPDTGAEELVCGLIDLAMSNGWFELQNGRGSAIIEYVCGEAEEGPAPLPTLAPQPPALEPVPMAEELPPAPPAPVGPETL